jgi:hypothetical protein
MVNVRGAFMTATNGAPKTVVTSPDPSDRSTAALSHEIAMIKELVGEWRSGQERAVALLQAQADKSPSIEVVNQDLIALGKIIAEKFTTMAEKFATIQIQFTDRDLALIAALAAAEKAVAVQNNNNLLANNKQEGNFTKLIDGIGERLLAQAHSSDDKIDGLRERMNAVEAKSSNTEGKSTGVVQTWGIVIVVLTLIVSASAIVISKENSPITPIAPTPPIIYLGPSPSAQMPTVIQPRAQ